MGSRGGREGREGREGTRGMAGSQVATHGQTEGIGHDRLLDLREGLVFTWESRLVMT